MKAQTSALPTTARLAGQHEMWHASAFPTPSRWTRSLSVITASWNHKEWPRHTTWSDHLRRAVTISERYLRHRLDRSPASAAIATPPPLPPLLLECARIFQEVRSRADDIQDGSGLRDHLGIDPA